MSGKLGELFICAMCKRAVRRTSGNQVVCPICAPERARQKAAEADQRKKQKKQEADNRKAENKTQYTLAEMERAARENGMTYGKYSVALEWGMVAPPKKTKGAGRK